MSADVDYKTNVKLYDICKWVLEYIRNIAIVITIGVAYKISNITSLLVITIIGSVALIAMAQAQLNKFIYSPNFMDGKPKVIQVVTAMVLACLFLYFATRVASLVDETVEFQSKNQNNRTYVKSQTPCRFTLDLSGYACVQ